MATPDDKSPYRLFVEGPDDLHSVTGLLKRNGFNGNAASKPSPYVHPSGGVDKLLELDAIKAALKTYPRVGWVFDADLSPEDRWRQVRDLFKKCALDLPESPVDNGIIVKGIHHPNSQVGVWMMPDNRNPGNLEDFLAELVPPEDKVWHYAGQSTDEARKLGAPIEQKDRSKGVIHSWLAWQERPGMPFGQALTARVLSHDGPLSEKFVAWFHKLFSA